MFNNKKNYVSKKENRISKIDFRARKIFKKSNLSGMKVHKHFHQNPILEHQMSCTYP